MATELGCSMPDAIRRQQIDDELTMVVKKGARGDGAGEPATISQATSAVAVVNATSAMRARRVHERRVGSMRLAMMISSVVWTYPAARFVLDRKLRIPDIKLFKRCTAGAPPGRAGWSPPQPRASAASTVSNARWSLAAASSKVTLQR